MPASVALYAQVHAPVAPSRPRTGRPEQHRRGRHCRGDHRRDTRRGHRLEAISAFKPAAPGRPRAGHLRNELWRDHAVIRVQPWARAESLEFLRRSLPPQAWRPDDAATLAADLGDLPLALEGAVALSRNAPGKPSNVGGSPSRKGAKKGSNDSTVPMICRH